MLKKWAESYGDCSKRMQYMSEDMKKTYIAEQIKRANENPDVKNEELVNLTKLKRLMDEYINGKDITIKVVLLKEFAKELGEVVRGQ